MATTSNKCFPLKPCGRIDRKKIREEYNESPHMRWVEFCAEKNYDWNYPHIPWGLWQRQKLSKKEWDKTAIEMSERMARLEPDYAKRVIQTVEKLPQTMLAMWEIVQFRVSLEHKKVAEQLKNPNPEMTKQMMKAPDLQCLATTAKTVSECLYKALGIEQTKEAIKEIHNRFEAIDAVDNEDSNETDIKVVTMSSKDVSAEIKEAFEKYVDKPFSTTDI